MAQDFYDKVAKKFGGYHSPSRYIQEFKTGNSEEIFKDKLVELSGKDKYALDSGCGDGVFTLNLAPHFKKITGNDTSKLMLEVARKSQKEKGINNAEFREISTDDLVIQDNSLDVIFARRGMVNYPLFYKMLKPGGYVLSIEIGEKDTMDLQKTFGRGQMYNRWGESRLDSDVQLAKGSKYKIEYNKEFFHSDFFATKRDLDTFLQGVPIFEDYESTKDKKYLEKYIEMNTYDKGIELKRHRYIILALK